MKKILIIGVPISFFFLVTFILYGCKKDMKNSNVTQQAEKAAVKTDQAKLEDPNGQLQRALPNCLGLNSLGWSGNDLQGYYGSVNFIISNPHWRITCDDGTPITLQNYQPFYGEISIAGSQGTVLMQPFASNQFVITYSVWSLPAGQAILNGINDYQTAYNTWLVNVQNGVVGAVPDVANYVPASSGSIVTLTGKLVRTTNGSTFAIVGTCYPDVIPCLGHLEARLNNKN